MLKLYRIIVLLAIGLFAGEAYAVKYWLNSYFSAPVYGKNFILPMIEGYRLDWCYRPGNYCGRAVANAFCRSKGYYYAGNFTILANAGPTRYISTDEICTQSHCTSFYIIRCVSARV